MTATLTFNLPEDRSEHLAAVNAMETLCALRDMDNELRAFLRHQTPLPFKEYGIPPPFDTEDAVACYVRARLGQIIPETI